MKDEEKETKFVYTSATEVLKGTNIEWVSSPLDGGLIGLIFVIL